jgi:hypothetical protein
MAANVEVKCPKCGRRDSVRFDPGPDDDFPSLATLELAEECPNHGTHAYWKFMVERWRHV